MKYSVRVAGKELQVERVGEKLRVNGEQVDASLSHSKQSGQTVLRVGERIYRVAFDKKQSENGSARRGLYTIWVNGARFEVDALDSRRRAIDEATLSSGARRAPDLKAPMPGLIVKIRVEVGDVVSAGQGLVVMEAMKMENELKSAAAGIVKKIHAQAGQAVEKGTVLIELGD